MLDSNSVVHFTVFALHDGDSIRLWALIRVALVAVLQHLVRRSSTGRIRLMPQDVLLKQLQVMDDYRLVLLQWLLAHHSLRL
jgi:hypothetical protein